MIFIMLHKGLWVAFRRGRRYSLRSVPVLAPAALSLLKGLPLKGAAVAGDAAFCRRALCKAACGGGEYPFTVKANRPRSMADIAESFRRHPRNLRRKPP